MLGRVYGFLSSTTVALVLLVLIFLSCVAGVLLPREVGKEAVFSSLWFNSLLIFLTINIFFCILRRTRVLRFHQAGTTIFHLGLIVLFFSVVYDRLFFFEGALHITEGETLRCSDPASWDSMRTGRFFQLPELDRLGDLQFHKLHIADREKEGSRGSANEVSVGEDVETERRRLISVARPLKYEGFEFYRAEKDGFSPLIVLRDRQGKVLYGAYAPLQTVRGDEGNFVYRSGTTFAPGSFPFPQDPRYPTLFSLQTTYHPGKIDAHSGEVSLRVQRFRSHDQGEPGPIYDGRMVLKERIRAGEYLLSVDDVRSWTTMNINYRPGLPWIFGSFWIAFGGLILNLILKMAKRRSMESATI